MYAAASTACISNRASKLRGIDTGSPHPQGWKISGWLQVVSPVPLLQASWSGFMLGELAFFVVPCGMPRTVSLRALGMGISGDV